MGQSDWLSEDYLTYLRQSARRGQPAVVDGLLEEAGEGDDLAGLEAFFAREGSAFRLQ